MSVLNPVMPMAAVRARHRNRLAGIFAIEQLEWSNGARYSA